MPSCYQQNETIATYSCPAGEMRIRASGAGSTLGTSISPRTFAFFVDELDGPDSAVTISSSQEAISKPRDSISSSRDSENADCEATSPEAEGISLRRTVPRPRPRPPPPPPPPRPPRSDLGGRPPPPRSRPASPPPPPPTSSAAYRELVVLPLFVFFNP